MAKLDNTITVEISPTILDIIEDLIQQRDEARETVAHLVSELNETEATHCLGFIKGVAIYCRPDQAKRGASALTELMLRGAL
jgi:hypothetical protein